MGWLLIEKKYKIMKKIRDNEGLPMSKLEVYASAGGTTNTLKILEKMGVVISFKKGRKKISKLTKRGKRILGLLEVIDKRV